MNDEKKQQILAELRQYINEYPPMQDGDLTAKDIGEEYGITERQALIWMERTERDNPGEWKRLRVQVPGHRWVWVLRKISAHLTPGPSPNGR